MKQSKKCRIGEDILLNSRMVAGFMMTTYRMLRGMEKGRVVIVQR